MATPSMPIAAMGPFRHMRLHSRSPHQPQHTGPPLQSLQEEQHTQNSQAMCFLAVSSPVFGPRQVYGLIDGSVTVKCFYPPTKVNRHDRKYWCRESSRSCVTVVSSNGYTSSSYQGRASISDYPEQGVMVVNISQLALSDRGTYQCGIGLNGRGLSYKVSLDISEGNYILKYCFSFTFSLVNRAPQDACPGTASKSSGRSLRSGSSGVFLS